VVVDGHTLVGHVGKDVLLLLLLLLPPPPPTGVLLGAGSFGRVYKVSGA
jgi:hypothetical protein